MKMKILIAALLAMASLLTSESFASSTVTTRSSADVDFQYLPPHGSEGRSPHQGFELEYRTSPENKSVNLKWSYMGGGEVRSNVQEFATRYTPTAVVQVDESLLIVFGSDGAGMVFVEKWEVSHPAAGPMPAINISTGKIVYPKYIASVSSRSLVLKKQLAADEYVRRAFVAQDAAELSAFVILSESRDFIDINLESSAWTTLYKGTDSSSPVYVPALADIWTGSFSLRTEALGNIYVLYRLSDTPSGSGRIALVLADADLDGVIDSITAFSSNAAYAAAIDISYSAILEVYF